MEYKRLFIFVEGFSDRIFFENIFKPIFEGEYDYVEIIEYRNDKRDHISNYIRSIECMNKTTNLEASLIFVSDLNKSPCITAKKVELIKSYKNLNKKNIIVVVRTIEGWFLAGLDMDMCKTLGLVYISNTNTNEINKREFKDIIPKNFISEIAFRIEVTKRFSLEVAKKRNISFNYFMNNFSYKNNFKCLINTNN